MVFTFAFRSSWLYVRNMTWRAARLPPFFCAEWQSFFNPKFCECMENLKTCHCGINVWKWPTFAGITEKYSNLTLWHFFLQLWIQRSTCSIPGLTVDRVKKLSGLCYEVIDSGPKFQATVPIFDCQSRHLESSWTFGLAPLIYLQCFSFWPQEGSKRHQKDGERRDLKWKRTILSQSWRNIFKIFTTVNLQLYHFLVVLRLVKKNWRRTASASKAARPSFQRRTECEICMNILFKHTAKCFVHSASRMTCFTGHIFSEINVWPVQLFLIVNHRSNLHAPQDQLQHIAALWSGTICCFKSGILGNLGVVTLSQCEKSSSILGVAKSSTPLSVWTHKVTPACFAAWHCLTLLWEYSYRIARINIIHWQIAGIFSKTKTSVKGRKRNQHLWWKRLGQTTGRFKFALRTRQRKHLQSHALRSQQPRTPSRQQIPEPFSIFSCQVRKPNHRFWVYKSTTFVKFANVCMICAIWTLVRPHLCFPTVRPTIPSAQVFMRLSENRHQVMDVK